MAQGFNTPDTPTPFGLFSNAAWQPEGRVLHISGHVSEDVDGNVVGAGDIGAQTRQTLVNVQNMLSAAGGVFSDIAKLTIFVTDMSGLAEIHEVRAEFFDPPYPASSLVQVVQLVRPEFLIEIEAVAVIPFDRATAPW